MTDKIKTSVLGVFIVAILVLMWWVFHLTDKVTQLEYESDVNNVLVREVAVKPTLRDCSIDRLKFYDPITKECI